MKKWQVAIGIFAILLIEAFLNFQSPQYAIIMIICGAVILLTMRLLNIQTGDKNEK